MATITYLILPSVVKERMALHENVDDKLIYPEILAVQDLQILPLLGSKLFNKLLADIAAGSLSGYYKTLMDDYLIMAICNLVMSELPESLNYQYFNKGVSQKTVDNATQPSMSDLYNIIAKYKSRGEHYIKRARLYLIQNQATNIPEYRQRDSGVDIVVPDGNTYTSPIYLGDESELPRDDYSLNNKKISDNSNDPYLL